jgi:hypothetical protein
MIAAGFSDYLPLSDLVKILIACVAVAVIAPAAVSVAVLGLDIRDKNRGAAQGALLIGLGVIVLAALIAVGIYALSTD